VKLLGDAAPQIAARYRRMEIPDLSYATVKDYCDSADCLPQICGTDGDLKNVQRPWMLKAVLARVPAGGRLLEIGAGEPAVAAALHEAGYDVTVIDPYEGAGNGPTAYEDYRLRYPEVKIVKAEFDEGTREIAGQSFDCIYSISVLEHIRHHRFEGLFAGVAAHLRAGGQSLHCVDHVLEGAGRDYHVEGLKAILRGQDRLRQAGAVEDEVRAAASDRATDDLLGALTGDLETFYLSPQGHHLWRGGQPYEAFPFRKVVSIQISETRGGSA
jgi:hypothetical protein